MSYDMGDDYSYVKDSEEVRKMIIEHTTGRWETAKSLAAKCAYLLFLGVIIYAFWLAWSWYFWLVFFAAVPFNFWIARKVVRVPIRWFLKIDIVSPRLYLYGVPKRWHWEGTALNASDNSGLNIAIVHTIRISKAKMKVNTSMSPTDYDRLEWLTDSKVLDRTLDRLERASAHLHFLKRNFWNQVIKTIREIQGESVEKPITEILSKSIDLDMPSSVGKRYEKGVEVEQE